MTTLVIWLSFWALFVARVSAVFQVRTAFIFDKSFPNNGYQKLPRYESMLLNPRHQLRWTKKQWAKWLESQA